MYTTGPINYAPPYYYGSNPLTAVKVVQLKS